LPHGAGGFFHFDDMAASVLSAHIGLASSSIWCLTQSWKPPEVVKSILAPRKLFQSITPPADRRQGDWRIRSRQKVDIAFLGVKPFHTLRSGADFRCRLKRQSRPQ
jgi:hypothetical protein